MTTSPNKLIIILYNKILQRIHLTKQALKKKEPTATNENLNHAHNILTELNHNLNTNKTPKLTKKLENLYQYYNQQLIITITNQKPTTYKKIYNLLKPLHNTWTTTNKQLKTPTTTINE